MQVTVPNPFTGETIPISINTSVKHVSGGSITPVVGTINTDNVDPAAAWVFVDTDRRDLLIPCDSSGSQLPAPFPILVPVSSVTGTGFFRFLARPRVTRATARLFTGVDSNSPPDSRTTPALCTIVIRPT